MLDPRNADFVAGRAPRPVADDAAATFTLIGRILLFFVVCVGLILTWQFYERSELASRGRISQAHVTDARIVSSKRGLAHELTIRFVDPTSREESIRTISVRGETYRATRVGGTLAVRRLPGRPDVVTADQDFRARGLGAWRLGFFGLFLVLALGTLGYGEVLKRRDARLASGSRVIAGTIVDSRGENTGSGYWVRLRYRAEAPGLGTVEGTSRAVRPDLANGGLPQAGREVAIWFRDPETHRML